MKEADIQKLLDDLCLRLGFCLPPLMQQRLAKFPPKDPKRFTDAIVRAEGLSPEEMDTHLYREVLHAVTDLFKSGNSE